MNWPIEYNDFMPFADNNSSYWTGLFSSRPNDKKLIRDAQHVLHSSSKLFALDSLIYHTSNS